MGDMLVSHFGQVLSVLDEFGMNIACFGQTHRCVSGCVVNTGGNTGVLLALLKTANLSKTIHGRVPGRVSTPILL